MNIGTFNDNPQENTVPNWLLPCTCGTQRCHCNSQFRPDILCIKGLPCLTELPTTIDQTLTIQFIEFTYCNDRYSSETLEAKANKYKPLIENISALGWKIDPLIVITAGARGATHIPPMNYLMTNLNYLCHPSEIPSKTSIPSPYNTPCPYLKYKTPPS